ncbi:DUF4350 domain-containing protein [Sphingobacterium sp. Mn56C]|uniref:DUF4350 domain-containing protein n=1 Tax=Sphingobacterium sp. Mn56C TaxID=3395261 RepID=UPI003BE5B512
MKQTLIFSVMALCLVVLGIALIDASSQRPLDWNKSLRYQAKAPYGLYVFRQELQQVLGGNREISDFSVSYYTKFSQLDSLGSSDNAVVGIKYYNYLDEYETTKMLDFVGQGGEVFLAGYAFSDSLLDSLGIKLEELNEVKFRPKATTVAYSLGNDTALLRMDKVSDFLIFSKLDPKTCTIMGQLQVNQQSFPMFIRIAFGKGYLYLHSLPELFTNYYMLQQQSYLFASRTINVMRSTKVHIYDSHFKGVQPETPLRVILSMPGFNQAWYLLLVGLLALLLFKSKREQAAIPILRPEPNRSKAFAQVIGSLYYENGNPGNIIHKKIEYFLYSIRVTYTLDTTDLTDERFIRQLASKSTVSLKDTEALIALLNRYKQQEHVTFAEVKMVNQQIEEFKSKANTL